MDSVYVIGPENGPYKVGRTADIPKRLSALQTGNPSRLLVHFSIQEADAADLELAAHNALLKQRLSGEWFNAPLSDIIAAIERRGAVVSVAPVTMTASSFINWLADMKSAGLARSDAAAAKLLGVSANAVVEMKKRGADRRTALACRALRHCMEPYE